MTRKITMIRRHRTGKNDNAALTDRCLYKRRSAARKVIRSLGIAAYSQFRQGEELHFGRPFFLEIER